MPTRPKPAKAGTRKSWYIKERHNPQLGVYYVACGQLWKKEAKRQEQSLHGFNTLRAYETEEQYNAEIARLRASGAMVH